MPSPERSKLLKYGIVGTVVGAAAGIAAAVDCKGENDNRTEPTAVVRTVTPSAENTPIIIKTEEYIDPQIELSDIARDNYLRFFETGEYSLRDKEIRLEPTDENDDYLRTFNNFDSTGKPIRMGVLVEKIEKESGLVVGEISRFSELFEGMGKVSDERDALAVLMATDQEVVGYIGRNLPVNNDETVYVGALVDRGQECILGSFEVDRDTGEIVRIASGVGQELEGECDR